MIDYTIAITTVAWPVVLSKSEKAVRLWGRRLHRIIAE